MAEEYLEDDASFNMIDRFYLGGFFHSKVWRFIEGFVDWGSPVPPSEGDLGIVRPGGGAYVAGALVGILLDPDGAAEAGLVKGTAKINAVVLGHFSNWGVDNYVTAADKLSAVALNVPEQIYRRVSPEEFWNMYNKPFLDWAHASGLRILLKTPADLARPGSPFMREIEYMIKEYGYSIAEDGLELLRP